MTTTEKKSSKSSTPKRKFKVGDRVTISKKEIGQFSPMTQRFLRSSKVHKVAATGGRHIMLDGYNLWLPGSRFQPTPKQYTAKKPDSVKQKSPSKQTRRPKLFKEGDVVKCVRGYEQCNGHVYLKAGRIYTVESYDYNYIAKTYLVKMKGNERMWDSNRFVPATLKDRNNQETADAAEIKQVGSGNTGGGGGSLPTYTVRAIGTNGSTSAVFFGHEIVGPGGGGCGLQADKTPDRHTFSTGAVRGTDANDTRFDLISPILLRELAATYAEGAKKYGDTNWLQGIPSKDLLNHALRHINLWQLGDSSEPHLAHAIWNLAAILHFTETKPEMIERQYAK